MVNQDGQPVQIWDCLGYWNQRWTFDSDGKIVNDGHKCLTASGPGNGASVFITGCSDTLAQKWEYRPNGSILGLGGRCLDAPAFAKANGTLLQLWDCNGGANQQWNVIGTFHSALGTLEQCLDVTSGNPNYVAHNGDLAQLWDCTGNEDQEWTLAPY
jgi:hypothetical protein